MAVSLLFLFAFLKGVSSLINLEWLNLSGNDIEVQSCTDFIYEFMSINLLLKDRLNEVISNICFFHAAVSSNIQRR